MNTPAPTVDPGRRDPAEVSPTSSYRPDDPVWIYRSGTWCSGVVEAASARAATVTYRPTHARGTAVDTVTAPSLLARTQVDPMIDRNRER
jgi:D-alanyl-D-alanine dipeptidase